MMRKELLTVDQVHGAWAIMSPPAKANASDWRSENTVDLDETSRVVEQLISSGVNGILSLGTLGECATLTWEEKSAFMRTIVETARGRVPVFGGTSSLSTRETVRQTRAAREIGVDGVMAGPPMWCAPDVPTADHRQIHRYRHAASRSSGESKAHPLFAAGYGLLRCSATGP